MKLAIKDIIADTSIDIRQKMDEETIQHYMDVFERLPAIVVFDTGEGYLLADGFHRLSAAERLGRTEIEVEVKEGTRSDALELAAYANAITGLKLTSEERRIGVRRLHRIHPDWTSREIADLMNCSPSTVDRVIQAIAVYQEAPTATQLTESHATALSQAPREHWEPLARAAQTNQWTAEETRAAVQNIKDDQIPVAHKQALLLGETEPVVFKNGEPAVLPATINRQLEREARTDYPSFLEKAFFQLDQLRRFPAQEVIDGLPADRVRSLIRQLPGNISYLNELVKIGEMRLEIWREPDGS